MLTIRKSAIKDIDISSLIPRLNGDETQAFYYREDPSKRTSEYPLLKHISDQFENEIFLEFGCLRGGSALVLAMNRKNIVFTIDNALNYPLYDFTGLSIRHIVCNAIHITDNLEIIEKIPKAKLINIDISHDGNDERILLQILRDYKFRGIVVMDDLYYHTGFMKSLWESIPEPKQDLTEIGHFSGTGIVDFGYGFEVIE